VRIGSGRHPTPCLGQSGPVEFYGADGTGTLLKARLPLAGTKGQKTVLGLCTKAISDLGLYATPVFSNLARWVGQNFVPKLFSFFREGFGLSAD
jgi:hypothetical protein